VAVDISTVSIKTPPGHVWKSLKYSAITTLKQEYLSIFNKIANFSEKYCCHHWNRHLINGIQKFIVSISIYTSHEVDWRQHWPLTVSVRRLSKCWVWYSGFDITVAMASKQPWSQAGGLCNLGQAAGARLPHADPWRRPPHWVIRGGMVQFWPRHSH